MNMSLLDVINRISVFSHRLDNLELLQDQHWVIVDEVQKAKLVYIFRDNRELLISQDGRVQRAKWEYLGNNALLIEQRNEIHLLKHSFFDANVLALKTDGRDEYSFMVNESRYNEEMNSVDKIIGFLMKRYLRGTPVDQLAGMYRYKLNVSPLCAPSAGAGNKKATAF